MWQMVICTTSPLPPPPNFIVTRSWCLPEIPTFHYWVVLILRSLTFPAKYSCVSLQIAGSWQFNCIVNLDCNSQFINENFLTDFIVIDVWAVAVVIHTGFRRGTAVPPPRGTHMWHKTEWSKYIYVYINYEEGYLYYTTSLCIATEKLCGKEVVQETFVSFWKIGSQQLS